MTDYLQLARERAAGAPPADESNPYLPLAREEQQTQQQRMRFAIETALKDNPDLAAERQRLSQTSGLPLQVIERNLEEVRRKEALAAIDLVRMAQDSPVLARQLVDPTFTTTAVDDLSTLESLERSVGNAARYVMGAAPDGGLPGALGRGVQAMPSASAGAVVGAKRAAIDLIEPWARLVVGDDNWFAQMSKYYASQAKGFEQQTRAILGTPEGNLQAGVASGALSFAQNAKYLPFALTGPAGGALALGGMVLESFGASYNKAADKNLPLWQALGYASSDAMIEYWTEKIPLDRLIGGIRQGAPFLQTFAKQLGYEIPGEQLATVLQDLNEWATLNPNKPFSDYLAERPDAAIQTLIATVVGTGGNVMVTSGISNILDTISGPQWRSNLTNDYADMLQQQLRLAGQSALRERSPEQFRAHVQAVIENNDGASKAVYVDGEVLNQLPQEVLAQLPESVRQQIPAAAASGSVVEIPMADVLTVAPGTPLEQVLNENARMDPFAASKAEVAAAADTLKQEAERVIQQAADQEALRASQEAVKANVKAQLQATGRFRDSVNEGYATWASAFYTAYGSRLGMTPEQFYQRYPLRILGAADGQQTGVLNAPAGPALADVQAQWDAAGIRNAISERNGLITLGQIVVPQDQRGQGVGTSAMQALIDYADRTGQRIALSPSSDFGGNKKRLVEFYKRFGFVENKGRNKDFAVSETMIREPAQVFEQSVSTRLPTAKKATENPLEEMLVIGLDAAKADPKAFEKNVELIRQYPNFRDNKSASTADKAAEQFIRHVVDNLLWLYDQVPADTRERSKLWYDGARAIVDRWVPKYGVTDAQTAGMLAVLSPQKDWFQNVSLAERVLDIMSTQQDFIWSDEMSTTAAGIGALNPEDVGEITGKKLGEIDSDYLQAMWVRVYDQTYNERGYRVVSPEGDFTDWVYNADGTTKSKTAWGSFVEIGKAISIYKNGDIANISANLGEQHKVRNFYNNIFNPASQHGDVTIDTHAVAAGLLRPLSGSATEVLHNFGAGGAASSSVFGSKGTYGIYAEAYRRAADQRGVLPREMQSITWEAVRGLYTAGFKAQASNVAKIDAIWENYKKRRISLDDARQQLLEAAGRINPPEWEGSGAGASAAPWASSYTGELRQGSGPVGTAGRGDRGLPADAAAGVLEQGPRGVLNQNPAEYQGTHKPPGPDSASLADLTGNGVYPDDVYGPNGARYYGDGSARDAEAFRKAVAMRGKPKRGVTIYRAVPKSAPNEINAGDWVTLTRDYAVEHGEGALDGDYKIISKVVNAGNIYTNGDSIQEWGYWPDEAAYKQDERTPAKAPQPRGTFNPQTLDLVLNPNADLSTFFHETGHFFLEVLADVASQPAAPQEIADDMAKVLAWFGVPDLATWNGYSLDQKRPYHERWAESIEQYLMEGKAPSAELQPVMRRFRAWLINVYQSIQKFLAGRPDADQIQLNDDIRRVMDRMLATDEQIQQANEVAAFTPDEQADGEAAERLQKRSMADLKWAVKARDKVIAKLKRQAREVEKKTRAEATAEIDATPEMQAKAAIAKAEKDFEADPLAADMNIAVIADSFGFPSVDAMYRAIEAFGSRAEAIDALTERRMLEENGDLIDERAIQEAANEAVHNEARARSLATELRTQQEMLGQRTDTGQTNARGARITVNALVEAAKQFGASIVARTALRDLRSTAWRHTAAERRAGKRWQEATAKGDTAEAVKAKRDQVLNNAAAKAALDASIEAKKILEFFGRVTKGNDEKVVEKGRDPDIVNAARAVLAAYGIETPASKGAAQYLERVKQNDPDTWTALEPMIAAATQNAQPLQALTFEELQGLNEAIQAMWFLAKRSRQMEVGGDLMDIDDAALELFARMDEIGIPDRVPGEGMAVTREEERGLFLKQGIAFLRRVEQWAEGMDGKYGGPFLRLVFQPIKDAADRYRKERIEYRKKFQALVDNLAPIVGDSVIEAPELGYTFGTPGSTAGTAMNEILHAIAHTGNDSNKRKLLLGRGWATENADGTLDTTRWDSFIARLVAEGKLTQGHYDFVQGVWDLLEQTKPLAQKAHRDAFGRYFSEVTANEFIDPFGVTRRGGYLPAQVDSRLVKDNVLRKMAEEQNNSMAFSFPQPAKGFTMSRVEYNQPLMLDLRSLSQHIDKVLLFSHMTNPARDVRKLLTRKTVSQPLDRLQPAALESMLQPWLQRSAQQVVETPIVGTGKWARLPGMIRARAGMALMFANVSNTIQQVTGLANAAVRVKPSFMMRALAQYVANPREFSRAVWAASPYMDDRAKNEVSVLNEQMEAILIKPSAYETMRDWSSRHAYFLQTAFDNVISPIVWSGAFNQGLAEGMSNADAVRFADSSVRQTQGSTLPEDVSRLETGPAYARVFTQFVGYFNMMANTNGTALKQVIGELGLKKGAGKALYIVTMGLMVPIWAAEAIALAFKGGPEDEDDDGYLDDWLAAVFGMGSLKGLLAQIPIVGQFGVAAANRFNDNPLDDRISLSPAISLIEASVGAPQSVYKAIVDEGSAQKAIRDVATLVSVATGVPLYGVARPIGYAAGVAQGKIEPTGPLDVARGLITGTASPDSKQR